MSLTIARRIQYEAANTVHSSHEIHIYKHAEKTILIAVETDGGCSVTNSVAELVSSFCNRYEIKADFIIEYSPEAERGKVKGTLDKVELEWNQNRKCYERSQWKASSLEEVENLIGEKLRLDEAAPDSSIWLEQKGRGCRYCPSRQSLLWHQKEYCARCGNLKS